MTDEFEIRANAIVAELGHQRAILGGRAAELAGLIAAQAAEIERLKKRIAELEKPA